MSDANNVCLSRVALYHAAVDAVQIVLDKGTTHNENFKDLIIEGMRDMLPRDASEIDFDDARATVATLVRDNNDKLLPMPFEAAAEAKCEQEARLLVLRKYSSLQLQDMRPFWNDRAPIPLYTCSSISRDVEPVEVRGLVYLRSTSTRASC
jgi:hypothetical protein